MSKIIPLAKRIAKNSPQLVGDIRKNDFFIFLLAQNAFAVPVADVAEVINIDYLIPHTNECQILSHVIHLRKKVIPIINLRERLNIASEFATNPDSKIIIFALEKETHIAIIADNIEYRLKNGVLQNSGSSGETRLEAMFDNQLLPVFFIDKLIEKKEIETLKNVIKSLQEELDKQ